MIHKIYIDDDMIWLMHGEQIITDKDLEEATDIPDEDPFV
jgi:hypothetical protein